MPLASTWRTTAGDRGLSTSHQPDVHEEKSSARTVQLIGIPAHTDQKSVRRVSRDYAVPKWLAGLPSPYQYNSTFEGKYGVINYEIAGMPGDPLVVTFHGLNGTRGTFQDFEEVFPKYGFRVLSFDLYGHGLSASPTFIPFGSRYSLNFFVEQTSEILSHLNLENERLSLVGFSMGCVIAIAVAKRFSDQIDRIVLISPAGMLDRRPPPVLFLKCCKCCIPCVHCCICKCCFHKDKFISKFSEAERESGMADALWNRLMWQLFVKKGVVGAFLGCVSSIPLWSSEKLFHEVGSTRVPVLLLWGRKDTVVPVKLSKNVLNCFENGHLIVYREATHLLLADQPRAVLATVLTFLEMPPICQLPSWRYLFPFSPNGVYVPRTQRCPTGMTPVSYQKQLGYTPARTFRLPRSSLPPPAAPPLETPTPRHPETDEGLVKKSSERIPQKVEPKQVIPFPLENEASQPVQSKPFSSFSTRISLDSESVAPQILPLARRSDVLSFCVDDSGIHVGAVCDGSDPLSPRSSHSPVHVSSLSPISSFLSKSTPQIPQLQESSSLARRTTSPPSSSYTCPEVPEEAAAESPLHFLAREPHPSARLPTIELRAPDFLGYMTMDSIEERRTFGSQDEQYPNGSPSGS